MLPTLARPAAPRRTSRSRGWSDEGSMRPSGRGLELGKNTERIGARRGGKRLGLEPARLGDHARRGDDVGWLVAAAAMRRGREIGRVGFDKNPIERDVAGDGAQARRLLECDDAGKRDREPEIERGLGKRSRGGETMHEGA